MSSQPEMNNMGATSKSHNPMKEKKTKTPWCRVLLIALLAAACLLSAESALAAEVAGTRYHYESEQWNLDMIHAEGAFVKEALGQGIRVGVLDSGINSHEDFGERLLPGHNYTEDAVDENDTSDILGHGTRVAGLIAAANERGYIGTAPGAMLVPLKVTDGKEVQINAVCRAIYGGIDDYGCKVLNLSLGISEEYECLKEAIDYAAEKGVIIVAASGNDGTSTVYYPAGYDSVIGVGAVNQDETAYSFSAHNSSVCVTAPGVQVRSTGNDGGYTYCTGTSFSVPQVAGAAAVLLGLDPTLTPDQIVELMRITATDRGDEGYDEHFGYGILNLTGCIDAMAGEAATESKNPLRSPEDNPIVAPPDCTGEGICPMFAFTDLEPTLWYHDGIHWALENGVMNGVGDGLFDPYGATSRGMIVTTLYRLEGEPAVDGIPNPFDDLAAGNWYIDAVLWASENKIIEGYGDGCFKPNGAITREQLATILYRYAKDKDEGFTGLSSFQLDFPDACDVSDWATEAVSWIVMNGIINGKEGTLLPGGIASRSEAATMLMRFCELIK